MIIGPIAAISFDAIIGIVAVVAWLVIQGAAKRGGSNAPRPPPPGPGEDDQQAPQDDLRRFFEQLEKGIAQQDQSPNSYPPELPHLPQPLPPPITTIRQQAPAQTHIGRKPAAKPRPIPRPERVILATPTLPAISGHSWNQQFPETASSITTLRITEKSDHEKNRETLAQFQSRKRLRQMIVGAEILGKPIALRRSTQPLI